MMKNTLNRKYVGTELVTVAKVTDRALLSLLVHPALTTNLPTKLHSLIFNTLESMTDAPEGSKGWRKFADSSDDAKADMGCLARIMLENVKVTKFYSLQIGHHIYTR